MCLLCNVRCWETAPARADVVARALQVRERGGARGDGVQRPGLCVRARKAALRARARAAGGAAGQGRAASGARGHGESARWRRLPARPARRRRVSARVRCEAKGCEELGREGKGRETEDEKGDLSSCGSWPVEGVLVGGEEEGWRFAGRRQRRRRGGLAM
eukprot:3931960-Rhodomonas_salina.1